MDITLGQADQRLQRGRVGANNMLRIKWNLSRLTLIGLNLFVYTLLLYWAANNIDLGHLASQMRKIPAWAIIGSLAIYLVTLALYGTRMSLLLARGFCASFSFVNVGYALNALMPLRLGEVMKIFVGHRLHLIPVTALLSASAAEKLADILKLLLLGAIVAVFAADKFSQTGLLLPLAILAVTAVGVIAICRANIVRIVKIFPKGSQLRRISIELHKHARNYPLGKVLIATAGIWTLNLVLVYFTFNTYLSGVGIGLLDAATLYLILAIVVAAPSAPASAGVFEAAIVAYLTHYKGTESEAALATAVIFHLVIFFPPLIFTGYELLVASFFRSAA
jgi:uncharacterized membrane protein YbhN (UPF0104 family)